MRITRTWTISLPPELSRVAQALAKAEQRTKSELVREALRCYMAQRGSSLPLGASERLARVGELAQLYRERHVTRPTEAELRRSFRGVKQLHDRLKALAP